jgi:hypothetical protein
VEDGDQDQAGAEGPVVEGCWVRLQKRVLDDRTSWHEPGEVAQVVHVYEDEVFVVEFSVVDETLVGGHAYVCGEVRARDAVKVRGDP